MAELHATYDTMYCIVHTLLLRRLLYSHRHRGKVANARNTRRSLSPGQTRRGIGSQGRGDMAMILSDCSSFNTKQRHRTCLLCRPTNREFFQQGGTGSGTPALAHPADGITSSVVCNSWPHIAGVVAIHPCEKRPKRSHNPKNRVKKSW